ncbi:MAG: hypothetical protein JJ992_27795 [Planctomycetes bacterium]|nr:hypothetical protein [Planctomycetota bacterium]
MSHALSRSAKTGLAIALFLLVLPAPGCIGLSSQFMYWIKGGPKIEAEFDGLEGKRVAVVCVTNSSSYGPNSVSNLIERAVAVILREKGRDIEVVHHDEIADWIDNNDWNQMDYREIGKGVSADMVLAIDVDGIRLHEGMTLYKGRADVAVTVYDMNDGGKVAFRKNLPEFTFPQNGARHSTEMSEAQFRQLFVAVLAQDIAKYFYEYRFEDDFATDARGLNR